MACHCTGFADGMDLFTVVVKDSCNLISVIDLINAGYIILFYKIGVSIKNTTPNWCHKNFLLLSVNFMHTEK